jgi:hypothetical protein
MNREDIIKLANKAYGIDEEGKPFHPSALLHLEIFANLVASAQLEEVALEFDKMKAFGDTAASFAAFVRGMKK